MGYFANAVGYFKGTSSAFPYDQAVPEAHKRLAEDTRRITRGNGQNSVRLSYAKVSHRLPCGETILLYRFDRF